MTARYSTLILATQFMFCLSASAQDHLEPEQGMLNQSKTRWDYGQRLREVLMKDASLYHLARMVCLPSFEEEWVVTVVREEPKDLDGRSRMRRPGRGTGRESAERSVRP